MVGGIGLEKEVLSFKANDIRRAEARRSLRPLRTAPLSP